jgi:hypothetical protein
LGIQPSALGRVPIPQVWESQVRGYFVMFAPLIPPQRATDPSPVPLRLVKAPVAGYPLPKAEGKDPIPCRSPREMGRSWRCGRRVQWKRGHCSTQFVLGRTDAAKKDSRRTSERPKVIIEGEGDTNGLRKHSYHTRLLPIRQGWFETPERRPPRGRSQVPFGFKAKR